MDPAQSDKGQAHAQGYIDGWNDALTMVEAEGERQFHVDAASLNRLKFIIDKVRNNDKEN